MDVRRLGTSGLDVPVVGLGTWRTFDVRGPAAESNIHAEHVLSQGLGPRRSGAMVATKVWSSSPAEGRGQTDRAMRLFPNRCAPSASLHERRRC
jgi:hypothetical protein